MIARGAPFGEASAGSSVVTLGQAPIAILHPNVRGWERKDWDCRENLADRQVLKQRARELPAPIQMSDALSRNSPKVEGVEPLQANCLAHGRRQVVEVADNFPHAVMC